MANMARSTIPFALVIVLLFSISASAIPDDNVVYDVDGKPVKAGETYYIEPVLPKDGGGLALGRKEKSDRCPMNVIQEEKRSKGLPVQFHPAEEENYPKDHHYDAVIKRSKDVNIEFKMTKDYYEGNGKCEKNSLVWKVDNDDKRPGGKARYVEIDGKVGNPGILTRRNWFKIEKSSEGGKVKYTYQIVYCPTVCRDRCNVDCGTLGVIKENGKRFIGLDKYETHLVVKFRKATYHH